MTTETDELRRLEKEEGATDRQTIAALFVDPKGCYANVAGVELWDEERDARRYNGPHPVEGGMTWMRVDDGLCASDD